MEEKKVKAVLFDLDGILADTEPLHYGAWRIVFGKHGKKLSKRHYSKHYIGYGDEIPAADLVSRRVKGSERERLIKDAIREKRSVFLETTKKSVPYKEAVAFAKALKGRVKLAVVTSTEKESADAILDSIGAKELFDAVVTGSDVAELKPAPDLYVLAAKRLGVMPQDCIALEDTPAGVSSAKSAGMACAAVPNAYTRHLDFSGAGYVAKSLSKLSVDALEKIAAGTFAGADEDQVLDTIVKGFDWEDVLTSIVVEHGLDPENIDIAKLADAFIKYLHKSEGFDFRIPARFVIVAAILLSMKVETLLQEEERLGSIDLGALDVQLDAPLLTPPADRKATRPVSLTDLISALNKAFEMKQRKEPLLHRPAARLPVPIYKPPDIEKRVKELYERIRGKGLVHFSDLVPVWKRADIIATFLPLLYLVHRGKVECRQEKMFREITIKLR